MELGRHIASDHGDAGQVSIDVRLAGPSDAGDVADLAARTFPLACPAGALESDISEHVATHLSPQCFADHIADPQRQVAIAVVGGDLVGYTMLSFDPPAPDIARQLSAAPTAELSKIYVDAAHQGGGVARALMEHAIASVRAMGWAALWLGTHHANARAQRFYIKHGFVQVGTKRFRLGSQWEDDFVYECLL